ncbi:MAG: sucrose-6-phosphate hydrolase [Deltaproteobacteria bacterium]|jgi:beta-fructofuranosidase|nr:sucrose-6-phosphate hydrolase [Deltaproteobacteria bacterium]
MTNNENRKLDDTDRYRPYDQYSQQYLAQLTEQTESSAFRPVYHISPQSGLLNDPNGFVYYNGQWRLFYQAFPYGPIHGLKSWEAVTSPDLIHWTHCGRALSPDTNFDQRGVYSGSALVTESGLHLFYTGNSADENQKRLSCQMHALMDKNGKFIKDPGPIISGPPAGYTAHFRDPQVFRYDQGYRMIIGGQRQNGEGAILIYRSYDLRKWDFAGELDFTDSKMGYMIECPNLVWLDGRPLLICCPQGLSQNTLAYKNNYPNVMLVGDKYIDETNSLASDGLWQNFDEGFEYYAAQAINAADGRTLVVGWIGLPDVETPTRTEGWAHCLSLVCELRWQDGTVYRYPAVECQSLRGQRYDFNSQPADGLAFIKLPDDCYELEVYLPPEARGELSLAGLIVRLDIPLGQISVDRSMVAGTCDPLVDTSRTVKTKAGAKTCLNIFIDRSVFEIFINYGEKSITGRFFPAQGQGEVTWKGNCEILGAIWEISAD